MDIPKVQEEITKILLKEFVILDTCEVKISRVARNCIEDIEIIITGKGYGN